MAADAATPLLFDAEQTLARLGLTDEKSVYWLNEQARLQRIPCTMVGRTRKWSERDMADIITLFRVEPKNRFRK
jgi:hypothetical protein